MKEIKKYSLSYKTFRTYLIKKCSECKKQIEVLKTECDRGGGKTCNRKCYYERLKRVRPKGKNSWAWKGDSVGKSALHNWVEKHKGKPRKCEHCKTVNAKQYDWANVSQKYKRDLSDFIRLCRSCHVKFDYVFRYEKWKKSVQKLGWKVKK